MEFQEIMSVMFQVCLIPLLGILTKYVIVLINEKISALTAEKNDANFTKYMTLLQDTITDCVLATNQTYVDSLKQQGKFDLEAQKVAFQKTFDSVMNILTADAKEYLQIAIGDLDKYVTERIEASVVIVKAD